GDSPVRATYRWYVCYAADEPAPIRLRGLGQLLQGAPRAEPPGPAVRASAGRHLRRGDDERRVRGEEPRPHDPGPGARGRSVPAGVRRDPPSPCRGHGPAAGGP